MRCKPGDLAMVVRVDCDEWLLGRVVRVTSLDGSAPAPFAPQWFLEAPIPFPDGSDRRYVALADRVLKPLRDPGDDAQDESLRYLPPVPTGKVPEKA